MEYGAHFKDPAGGARRSKSERSVQAMALDSSVAPVMASGGVRRYHRAVPLRILITNHDLSQIGGSQLYALELATALRALPLPVIGRIEDGAMVLDLRCLEEPAKLTESIARLKRP